MSKEIIVNGDPRETRIAVREDGQLVELHIERGERVVGSIYKGRVDNVVMGQDAAFVDIGLERNAYLSAGDIVPVSGEESDEDDTHDRRGRRPRTFAPIRDLVRRNQEILVQVVKGPRGTKGSRVSTRISLPGRYLVFMPDENSTGVSRKIDDPRERDRLKRIIEGIRHPGYGLIVRTEAEGKTERELRQDLEYLERTWSEIRQKAEGTRAPNLVYQDLTLLFRILRDAFGSDVDQLVLDSADDFRKAHELLDFFGPSLKDRVVLYDGEKAIFDHFGLEADIERQLRRRVPLRSGGYLVIDQTEALVAIDVNSGKFGGRTEGLADTIVQTNLEAVNEIARQLRLRDMGGILVLDLIDMNSATDRRKVETALESALKTDKNRCKISHISPLGLIEMTRKRTGETVTEQMDQPCHYCEGTGRIASAESVSFRIQRELRRLSRQQKSEAFQVQCHPFVAAHFVGEEGEEVEALEHAIGRGVYVRAAIGVHQEQFEIAGGRLDEMDRRHATLRRGQIVEGRVAYVGESAQGEALLVTDDGHLVSIPQGNRQLRQSVRARITSVGRSVAKAEPVVKGDGGGRGGDGDVPPAAPTKPSEGSAEAGAAGSGRRRRRRGGRDNAAAA
ncbi:MAG: ribonuclease E/G [Armatimonadota bacterium]